MQVRFPSRWQDPFQSARRRLHELPVAAVAAAITLLLAVLACSVALWQIHDQPAAVEELNQSPVADAGIGLKMVGDNMLQTALVGQFAADHAESIAQLDVLHGMGENQLATLFKLSGPSSVSGTVAQLNRDLIRQRLNWLRTCAVQMLNDSGLTKERQHIEMIAMSDAIADLGQSIDVWLAQQQRESRQVATVQLSDSGVSTALIFCIAACLSAVVVLCRFWPRAMELRAVQETSSAVPELALELAMDVLQNGVLGIHVVDAEGRVIWSNAAEHDILGYSPRELIGRSFFDLHADKEAARGLFQRLQSGESVRNCVVRLIARDGTERRVLVDSNACFVDGQLTHTRCFLRDVTGQNAIEEAWHASERRLQLLIDRLPVGMFLASASGQCKYLNESWSRLSGIPSELGIQQGWANALHPDDRDGVVRSWMEFVESTEPNKSFIIECRFVHSDKTVVHICGEAIGLYDERGVLTEYLGTVVDITSQKRAQQELIRLADAAERSREQIAKQAEVLSDQSWNLICARERAEAASKTKSEFLANISHEIRTPLNAILGLTDLVLDGEMSDEQRDMLRTVHSSGEHLLTLINDVLDFSKIEADKLQLSTTDFRLQSCVEQATAMFSLAAVQQGLELTCAVSSDLPLRIHGDEGRLRQILVNLIGNAIKFTRAGSVRVTIDPEPVGEPAIGVHIRVSDTGIGIPQNKLDRIFVAFEQADGSTTRQYGGTGLGLSIVSRLVQMMNGRVWVESRVGQGSTFHVVLELERAHDVVPLLSSDNVEGGDDAPTEMPPLHILLAEDNPVNQSLMIRLLEREGHSVAAVADGEKAVEIAGRMAFDLVLMDVQMPIMGGVDAAAAIRLAEAQSGRPKLPIVALTASTQTTDREACASAGMDGYITKPVRRDALFKELSRIWAMSHPSTPQPKPRAGRRSISRDRILRSADNNLDLLRDLVDAFSGYAPKWQSELQTCAQAGDAAGVGRLAHKIRGSAVIFGDSPVVNTLDELETATQQSDASIPAEPLARVAAELAELIDELQATLEQQGSGVRG